MARRNIPENMDYSLNRDLVAFFANLAEFIFTYYNFYQKVAPIKRDFEPVKIVLLKIPADCLSHSSDKISSLDELLLCKIYYHSKMFACKICNVIV
ncbi:hypothetical protein CDAR_169911 [Caerostris darwini]|uniref:Maturase K n=1 Tax=Caerostris darwini TaxID=1538125 RepID=A0AAV4M9A0_9ARAC|nr:hypothetical protein CDAR_169911 [Caerostris darwini]